VVVWGGAANHRSLPIRSNQLFQFFCCSFAVSNDLRQEATTDCLTTMNGNYGASAVRMAKEMMATLLPNDVKTEFLKCLNKALC